MQHIGPVISSIWLDLSEIRWMCPAGVSTAKYRSNGKHPELFSCDALDVGCWKFIYGYIEYGSSFKHASDFLAGECT